MHTHGINSNGCSANDPDHPTLLYFINEPVPDKPHVAGRLDIDTTGLVLLTDDERWLHWTTSPRKLPTRPVLLEALSLQWVRLTFSGEAITTKRMFTALDNWAIALHRERIGAIVLDAHLRPGVDRADSQKRSLV
ncbi:pseudouridine synthase [Sodalis sp.]|uniref:pseudouridine synthase n=1 Tax=Sodalis sp. (in: enterobacteria) TaxID=1898979 RepID=UPI00387381FE